VTGQSAAIVLAHQGGWDEILFILGPIAVVVLLLRLAKRRVDATTRQDDSGFSSEDGARSPRPPT
jgi:hypothetical protein